LEPALIFFSTLFSFLTEEGENEDSNIPSKPSSTKSMTADTANSKEMSTFSAKWTQIIESIHKPIMNALRWLTHLAAANPKRTIGSILFLSIGLLVIGLLTNFDIDVDEGVLWTPENSRPIQHSNWIDNQSGFPEEPRSFVMLFHSNGDNVLGQKQVDHIFEALDAVRNLPKYDDVCAEADYVNREGVTTCEISGVTAFWNETAAIFQEQVQSDDVAIAQMSAKFYPDGTPVSQLDILGLPERDANGLLSKAQSYIVVIDLPDTDDAEAFETDALDVVQALDEKWEAESGNSFRVEVTAERSFSDEFTRAIVDDIPLVPIVFVIMSIFTCAIFFKTDKVRSRCLLGLSAVVSVFLSIATGYGLMFVSGAPFTSMTQILPFVLFGVGLDDAFITSGSYSRTDVSKDPVDRIDDTIQDVGLSITLTTVTSTLAFGLGAISSIPAVYWLCYYAFPTIFIVYLYQLTFFVACIVLDERRVKEKRRDCCVWISTAAPSDEERSSSMDHDANMAANTHVVDRFMEWYAERLLRPWVKAIVLLVFVALAGLCAFSASELRQAFKFVDILPEDSYVTDFFDAFDDLTVRSAIAPQAYFRFVDQSRPEVQQQMDDYINELVDIDAIVEQPDRFWLRDFKVHVNVTQGLADLDFNSQMDAFLAHPVYGDLYRKQIVRDSSGDIVASRCMIYMDNVSEEDVKEQIDALEDQRDVTSSQQVNKGRDDWSFFTYDGIYNIWEFYSVSVEELVLTTVLGVVSITAVALVLIPHWTAAFFTLPLICVLYVDLLGVMQWAGINVNAVSYIALVMSIGLLVDFLMHVLLRFYESSGNRKEKTIETLRTMGSSILIGGISTFLGTLPLAFSSSDIFNTIFIAFLGLVTLGIGHGLILLPVILSTIGPEDQIRVKPLVEKTAKHQDTMISGSDVDEEAQTF